MKPIVDAPNDREQLRQWVEQWRRAGVELEEIRRREIQQVDTREAIRQIFGSAEFFLPPLRGAGQFRPGGTAGVVCQTAAITRYCTWRELIASQ
jgi:hypothetical protein